MRMLNIVVCAGALAACASSKSAERTSSAMNESDRGAAAESARLSAAADRRTERANRSDVGERGVEERAELREEQAELREEHAEARWKKAHERQAAAKARAEKRANDGAPAADNTAVNERDDGEHALTALDQGGSAEDREITQKIRKAVVADDSLSFTAKNVKIITIDGKVTLRGPVESSSERAAIGAAAKRVAGARVDNQLEVLE